jgi:RNA polymerase sigma-70 factor (ECF subfamily)
VATFVKGFRWWFWEDATVTWITANGQPAALLSRDGTVHTFVTIIALTDGIDRLLRVRTPDKPSGIAASPHRQPKVRRRVESG